jgi:hypothetical protein
MILQSTPVLFVDTIAPSEAFFARLGLVRTGAVPETGEPGFVMMHAGGDYASPICVMLQTRANAHADLPDADPAIFAGHGVHLFITVPDIDAAAVALAGVPIFMPRRDTFYGSTEFGVVEPGGHHVTLAQFTERSE